MNTQFIENKTQMTLKHLKRCSISLKKKEKEREMLIKAILRNHFPHQIGKNPKG